MKKLPLMLVVAVALVGLALVLVRRDQSLRKPDAAVGQPLLPGFEDLLAEGRIQTLTLQRGDTATTLDLGEEGWGVREQFGYAADFGRLQRVFPSLARITIGQVLPNAELDPFETTLVQWLDADGALLGGVRLGQFRRQTPESGESPWGLGAIGRFVSREGSDTVYLIAESLSEFSADPKTWVDSQLLSLSAPEITAIEIAHPDGETVELVRVGGGDLAIPGLAPNEEFNAAKRHGVGGALAFLRFAEIVDPELGEKETGLDRAVRYRATLANGQIYEAMIGASPEGRSERYARFAVSVHPFQEDIPEDEEDSAREARKQRREAWNELKEHSEELSARLAPWTFLIQSYNAENMVLRREALVKERPSVEVEPASAAPAPGAEAEIPTDAVE